MLFTPANRRSYGFDLFDDFFNDPFFTAPASHSTQTLMRTDVKDDGVNYLMEMDLPGYQKEDIRAELKDGYLTISAAHNDSKDEKDKDGKLIRQERYSGSCKRTFYVGEHLRHEDIKAAFENGVLKLQFPKEAPKPVEEAPKFIQIEG
ncbi:MAG TPA: Hsp20/alpha crystallin family protein [Candidatus Ventrimonas merdavium]|nr:Hsp20/alpha crystallin family protein [Candidatus Ventrimonas merdavium]